MGDTFKASEAFLPGAIDVAGVLVWKGLLLAEEQSRLATAVRRIIEAAPLFHPTTRFGQKMSVAMTSAGRFGWISDRRGYRYERRHPEGRDWPPIPEEILAVWARVTGLSRQPDSCLVNYYGPNARMGLHQDRDEADFRWPVLSISLGDDALFRIGRTTRGGPTQSVWLASGDVVLLAGKSRLAYHGVDRIRAGSSSLVEQGGRFNLTLRVVE